MSQIVTFVIDKDLDIKNHLIALNAYRRGKELGHPQTASDFLEKLSRLASQEEVRTEIEKFIEALYTKREKLLSLADDINAEWRKIENDFIKTLEKVHNFPFPYMSIKGVLSSASRFGYSVDGEWFATKMFGNKFVAIDTATHELMHFMFHKYYDSTCEEKGLSKNQTWNVKESFTVLLNSDFDNFRLQPDYGHPPHTELREVIKTGWNEAHDFNKTLKKAIEFAKRTT